MFRISTSPTPLGAAITSALCCYAAVLAASAQTNPPAAFLEIPLQLRRGDVMVETRINGSEPLSFKLDTGFGITTIRPDLVDTLKLRRMGQMTIVGIAGEEAADTYAGAVFDFGGATYAPRRVAALPSETRRRGRQRDGILGAGFFRRFVVELDVTHHRMLLHEPAGFNYRGPGEVLALEFPRDTPTVEASITLPGHEAIRGRFEIDTGCDDFVCLGHEFVAANGLLEATNTAPVDTRRGVGGSAAIRQGTLAELRLGGLRLEKPSANFFLEGSPAGPGLAGHIGLGALQRFRLIFDYSRKQLVLEQ